MNERIKELWNYAADTTKDDSWESQSAFIEEFAELIVRECVDCLKPLSRNHSMVGAAQDTIREHFGIE